MPLSLICSCGSKLEIDDKFAGQVIRCPDCQKEIATTAQPVRALRNSWFAIFAVVLAIISGFSVVGALAAIGCGWFALRQIRLHPEQVGGQKLAWAGIWLGAALGLLGLISFTAPEVLDLDGFFRHIEWSRKLDFRGGLKLSRETANTAKFFITRPNGSWGAVALAGKDASDNADDLILWQPWHDAQVACMTIDPKQPPTDADDRLDEGKSRFEASQLLLLLSGQPSNTAQARTMTVRGKKIVEDSKDFKKDEMLIDLTAGGYKRTFIVRVIKVEGTFNRIVAVAAGTRTSRFHRLEPELRTILDSYQIEQ